MGTYRIIYKIAFRNNKEEYQCYNSFDTVPCVSQDVKEQVDKIFGLSTSKVVYNPIDNQKIQKEDILIRKGFNRFTNIQTSENRKLDINVTTLEKGIE